MRWCFFTFRVFAHSTVWLAERVTRCYLIYLHVCDGIETWTRWCVEQSSHSRSRSSFSVDLRRNILKAGVDSWLQSNYIRYQFSHEIRDLLTQSINYLHIPYADTQREDEKESKQLYQFAFGILFISYKWPISYLIYLLVISSILKDFELFIYFFCAFIWFCFIFYLQQADKSEIWL